MFGDITQISNNHQYYSNSITTNNIHNSSSLVLFKVTTDHAMSAERRCECHEYTYWNHIVEKLRARKDGLRLIDWAESSQARECLECDHKQYAFRVKTCGHLRFSIALLKGCLLGKCGGKQQASKSKKEEVDCKEKSTVRKRKRSTRSEARPKRRLRVFVQKAEEKESDSGYDTERDAKLQPKTKFVEGDLDIECEEWFWRKGGSTARFSATGACPH